MKYQVRQIMEKEETPLFEAGCIDVQHDADVAWISYNPRREAIQITCWNKVNVSFMDETDKETTVTIGKYGEKE